MGLTRAQAMDKYLGVVKEVLEMGIRPRCHFEDITRADFYGFVVPFAMELIKRNWILTNPIRMITVTATNLVPADEPEQSCLFESENDSFEKKKRKLAKTMDELRGRFGQGSITFGRTVKNELEGDEETEDEK